MLTTPSVVPASLAMLLVASAGVSSSIASTNHAVHESDGERLRALPIVEVTSDNVVITESCQIMVPRRTVIRDADGNGVLHIEGDGITVEMAEGSAWLQGADWVKTPDQRRGLAVRIDGQSDVTLSGLRIKGFGSGVRATDANGLTIDSCEIRDGFAPPLGADRMADTSPGRGVAISLEGSDQATVSGTRVRSHAIALSVSQSQGLNAHDNDFSYQSWMGIALDDAERASISRNTIDGVFGGDGQAVMGVHSKGDASGLFVAENAIRNLGASGTAVMIESGGRGATTSDVTVMSNAIRHVGSGVHAQGVREGLVAANAFSHVDGWAIDLEGEGTVLALNAINESVGGIKLSGSDLTARETALNATARAFETEGDGILLAKNAATGSEVFASVLGGTLQMGPNTMEEVGKATTIAQGGAVEDVATTMDVYQLPSVDVPGASNPSASEPAVGIEPRIVGDFFPWDGESVSFRTVRRDGKRHVFEVHGGDENLWAALKSNRASLEWDEAASDDDPVRFSVNGPSGVHPYTVRIAQRGELDRRIAGTLLRARWRVDVFEWETDPAADRDAWREEADGKRGRRARTTAIQLDFGDGSPSDLSLSGSVIRAKMRSDRFGVLAQSKLPLEPGRYEFRISIGPDDEARLLFDGEVVAELQTNAQPGSASAVLEIDETRDVEVGLEYVERSGPATLNMAIRLIDDGAGAMD